MPEIVILTTMVADDESAMTFACKLLAQESPVTGIYACITRMVGLPRLCGGKGK